MLFTCVDSCITIEYKLNMSVQNSSIDIGNGEENVCEARYYRRLQLMLRALLAISGEAPRQRFMSQQLLVKVYNVLFLKG